MIMLFLRRFLLFKSYTESIAKENCSIGPVRIEKLYYSYHNFHFDSVKALFALLVVLGLSSCVFAGGYGGGAGYQTYAAYRPAVYQQV